jgi:hypothetical protein
VNYDQPRELDDKSGWHYTRMRDKQVWPIGYCADHAPKPHLTEDGARQCYTRYLLDKELDLDGERIGTWRRCLRPGCGELTRRYAQVGRGMGPVYDLCDTHRTREDVAALFGTAGDSAHS